jgi:hypothetical protein
MDQSEGTPSAGAFTEEEERLHGEGFAQLRSALDGGASFDEAAARVTVGDAAFRRLVIDDYLKVTIAEQHFRDGRSTTEVAEQLRLPVDRIERTRTEMIEEVTRASVAVFRVQAEDFPPGAKN